MYSSQAPHPDHRDVKQNITKKLSSSLRALQMRYVTTDDIITSDDDDANSLCVALEAIFIHGLKGKFIRTQADRRRNKGRRAPLPQPAFWPLLKAITHRDVLSQLETISYINSDVGRCRSWLRLALNDSLMECYFLTLQREKSRLLDYYQPFALLLDAEDCDVVLSYLQGLSSLMFSLSYKSSILNEWTASPLTLSGLLPEDAERVVQYEPYRKKSLDSVSQSSGSDDTNNSMLSDSKMQLESSSLSLDHSSSSSQLSSSLGSDEQPLIQGSAPPASPQISDFFQHPPDTGNVEGTHAGTEVTDAGISDTTSLCPLHEIPFSQVLTADEEIIAETPAADTSETPVTSNTQDHNFSVSEPSSSSSTPAVLLDAHCVTDLLSNRSLSVEVTHTAELPKSQSWICEDDFKTEPGLGTVDNAGIGHLVSELPNVFSHESLKSSSEAFHVVHRRQIGLPNPFRGLLMMGTLERKNALGLYKPYYCELTPYEFRLQVEGDEQNCAESCSLLRCESVGPAYSDGRFDLQFPLKRLYLRTPSKDEAQDWVDRIQEAVQKLRPPQDDCWEILQCLDSPHSPAPPGERAPSCQVFDWTFQVEVEPDALKESVLYMKVQKSWTRFMFSLSERELKCFLSRSGEKTLYSVYTLEMVKDILPDSSLGSPSCFRLVTTKGSLQLQAENAAEAKAWRELVRAVFLKLEDDAVLFLRAVSFHIKPHIRDHLLFQYLLHIPTERGLDTQNFKCAGCHKQIGFNFGKVKLCAFSGLYYCDLCHQDEVSIIPSRIVHNWDLTERPVSRPALNFLKMVWHEPIFNLKCLNECLYQHTATMFEIRRSREKLRLLGEYLMTCRSGALKELCTSLDQRDYLLDCAHTYSVLDFKQIADGAFQCFLHSVLEFSTSHVYRCDLCSQRGFICQICNQDEIIYPFQFNSTTRCGDCKAVFHKPCKTPTIECPRCERRRKCQDQRVRMQTLAIRMQSVGTLDKDFVLVEHGFEYLAKDGSVISIKPHERYILLRRTNEHWWQVCRDHKSKPFYIPAKYVKELSSNSWGTYGTGSVLERSEDLTQHSTCTQYSYTFVAAEPPDTAAIPLPSPGVQQDAALSSLHKMGTASVGNMQLRHLVPTGSSRSLLDLSQLSNNTVMEQRMSQGSISTDHKLGPLRTFHNSKKVIDPLKRISLMCPPDLPPRIRPSQSLNDLQLIKSTAPSSDHFPLERVKIPGIHHHMEEVNKQQSNVAGSDNYATSEKHVNEDEAPSQSPIYANLEDFRRDRQRQRTSSQQRYSTSTIEDWETHTDKGSGQQFYYNPVTGETTWDCPFDETEETLQSPISPASLSPLSGEDWEKHFDESSGQFYFYNSVTRETSWDPPPESELHLPGVKPMFSPYGSVDRRPPTPEADYPEYSPDHLDIYPEADYDGQYIPPHPQHAPSNGQFSGWSCQIKDGQKLYINNHSGETWLQSEDQHGKTYFYTPDGSNSQWKLPQLGTSELQSGSSDLDQNSNVFTSWPHNFSAISLQKQTETKGLEKAGVLHKTKITENGKRMRKNWSSSWTVLEGGILTFFKDTKNLSSNSLKQSMLTVPEHTVRLQGATLSWATKDKSSKKHVMELKTRDGCEYLIHHDSEAITKDWFASLSKSIGKSVHISSDYTSENESLSEFGSTEKLGMKEEKKNPGQNSDSDRNVRAKLRKFLQRRPTLQSLRDKGYIRDQVFGCHLDQLCEREKRDVPEFVSQSIEVVERRGLDIDGLYRISGNLAVIQKLRYKVDHGENFSLDDGRWEDVHVITGALKLFFRELPEPLFPYSHYEQFVEAIKFSDQNQKIHRLKELILSLPLPNLETMRVLFRHLCRVIEHKDLNRMSVQSVAIVFGPTLLRPELEGSNIAMNMVYQNQIVEQILIQYKFIFSSS